MKIRSVGADLFHVDGETDMTKLTVASQNFANGPKNAWVATFPSLSPCYKLGTAKVTTAFPTEQQDQSGRRISASDPLQSRVILLETPVIFSTDLSVVKPYKTFVVAQNKENLCPSKKLKYSRVKDKS
jgi:hypothetical protein